MTQHNPWQALIQYYEMSHQLIEAMILERLQCHGVPLDTLTEDILQDYDMDYYDGAKADEILAQEVGLGTSSVVLDVGSGLGDRRAIWPLTMAAA